MSKHMEIIDKTRAQLGNSICANEECGRPFQCGIEAGKSSCWCFLETPAEDARIKFSNVSNCLCKDCLTKRNKDERNNNNL